MNSLNFECFGFNPYTWFKLVSCTGILWLSNFGATSDKTVHRNSSQFTITLDVATFQIQLQLELQLQIPIQLFKKIKSGTALIPTIS